MKHSQLGRSMIEMLGVLAIIAVLSVGGIAGYSKAMEKYKTTKLMNEYSELVRNLLEYRPNFEKNYPNTVGVINFRNTLYNAGLLPAKWYPDYQPAYLRDSAGNYLGIEWNCHNIKPCSYVVVIIFGGSGMSYGKKRDKPKRMCMQILQTVIQPLHDVLKIGRGTWALGGSAKPYYGDAYCDGKKKLCLRDMSLADIKASCDPCDVAGRCEVSMYF